jgi:hypothetical protein
MCFYDLWNIPSACTRVKTSVTCAAVLNIYFNQQKICTTLTGDAALDAVLKILKALLYKHCNFGLLMIRCSIFVKYVCAEGNDCAWVYVKKNVPSLFKINYQPIYHAFKVILYDPISITNVSKCYITDVLTNCSQEICNFFSFDEFGEANLTCNFSYCSHSTLDIDTEQQTTDLRSTVHTSDVFAFSCYRDKCNNATVEANVKHMVQINQNWIILPETVCSYLQLNYSLLILILTLMTICKD